MWGREIWIKRDDLTGSGLSGNKVRKLEFLISDALNKGTDTLVTCGYVQSNHCRATVLAARQNNFKCSLLLRGEQPYLIDGNLLINSLAGAGLNFISEKKYYADINLELIKLAEKVKEEGGIPYIIPEGGSNAIGAWGFVKALSELKAQCKMEGISPRRIICATGSAGTHAGLLAGAYLEKWDVDIISVAVAYNEKETKDRIFKIVKDIDRLADAKIKLNEDDVHVIDQFIGQGYAKAGDPEFEVMSEVASLEGILLDPVYTGKAIRALKDKNICEDFKGISVFWHTGGMFGIFPFRESINEFLSKETV